MATPAIPAPNTPRVTLVAGMSCMFWLNPLRSPAAVPDAVRQVLGIGGHEIAGTLHQNRHHLLGDDDRIDELRRRALADRGAEERIARLVDRRGDGRIECVVDDGVE